MMNVAILHSTGRSSQEFKVGGQTVIAATLFIECSDYASSEETA
jgi:hypothetical protein